MNLSAKPFGLLSTNRATAHGGLKEDLLTMKDTVRRADLLF
jgi:hypothetical protein